MPTYSVKPANIVLTAGQEEEIAAAITNAHQSHTGAPGFFAQVFFEPVASGRHYIGGRPNPARHIFVHGLIRQGRTDSAKSALMQEIATEIQHIAGIAAADIWVYVQEIAAGQMIEFGRFLPEPGGEQAWRDGMAQEKLDELRRAGIAV